MSDEPSPLPWRVIRALEDEPARVIDSNDEDVAIELTDADAALIVTAVNERDRLRAALKRIAGYEDGIVGCIESGHASGIDWDGITFAMIQEARAALGEEKE